MTAPSTVACYAKLVGPSQTVFYLTRPRATLGRRVSYPEGTLYESGEKVAIADFFVGSSPCISRIHCVLSFNAGNGRQLSRYEVACCSKNGMWVDGVYITRESGPYTLRSRSLLLIGDCPWYFLLPRDERKINDSLSRPPAVSYVSIPLITRSSRQDEQEREREREQRRRKEREERDRLKAMQPTSTSPLPGAQSPTPIAKPPPPPLQESWMRQEREGMKEALLSFACARADLLQRDLRAQSIHKSDSEVATFVIAFIAALMKLVGWGSSMLKPLKQISPHSYSLMQSYAAASSSSSSSLLRANAGGSSSLMQSLLLWPAMVKHGKSWARRMLHLNALHQQMITRGSLHTLDDLVSAPRGRLPAVWWSRECDVDLLIGIYKWGYGRFEDVKNDKELCFSRIMEQLKERRAAGRSDDSGPAPAEGEDIQTEGQGEGEEDEDEDESDEEEDEDEEEEDEEGGGAKKGGASKSRASASSTPAASRPPSPFARTLTGQVSKGKTEDGWPISLALLGRFRQLLKVMKTRDAAAAHLEASGKRKAPDAPVRNIKRVKREVIPGWTGEERSVFTKALLTVGVPLGTPPANGRWTHMRFAMQQTGTLGVLLRKEDAALDDRVEALQKEARALLSALNEPQLLDTLHSKSLAILGSLHSAAIPPPELTPILASHLLSHLRYFHLSRTALSTLPSSIPPAPAAGGLAPAWWKVGMHDRYLVQAFNKLGIQLQEIDDDLAFPFKMYGGVEGWAKGVGLGTGIEWLVERWKAVVDFWTAENEQKAKGKAGAGGKDESKKERSSSRKASGSSSGSTFSSSAGKSESKSGKA